MKKLTLVLAFLFVGCMDASYSVPAPMETTPNTIPPKAERSIKEAENINGVADSIQKEDPKFTPEVEEIKGSTAAIIEQQKSITAESIVHDTEKQKLTKDLQEVTIVVKQLQDRERERQLDEARNIKYGVIALFALTTVGFIWYGFSIPGIRYTIAGAVMAVITVVSAIIWNYLEQKPLAVTACTVIIGIGAVTMYLMKKEEKDNPLGFE